MGFKHASIGINGDEVGLKFKHVSIGINGDVVGFNLMVI